MNTELFTLGHQDNPRVPMPPRPYRHRVPLQMRFSDIDILGHLNNSVYLNLFDLGKTAYFQNILGDDIDWHNVGMVVGSINLIFFAPTLYRDKMEVMTMVESIGQRSLTLEQRMVNMTTGQTHAVCRTVMVGFDAATGRSADFREDWVRAVEDFEDTNLRD